MLNNIFTVNIIAINVYTTTVILLRDSSINDTPAINMLMLLVAKAKGAFANRHVNRHRVHDITTTIILLGGDSSNDTVTINIVMLLAARTTDALASCHKIKQTINTIKN